MEASGLVSVMPQAWMIGTPKRLSKSRISLSGTAEPPQTMRSSADARSGGSCSWSMPCQTVGTAPDIVTRSETMSSARSAGAILGPGRTSLEPASVAA